MLCWSSHEETPNVQGKRNPNKTVGVVRGSVESDSVRPHRRQPTRLHCLWDSPGKNTGVLGLAQRKRASPRGEAGTSGFLCVSDSDRRDRLRPPGVRQRPGCPREQMGVEAVRISPRNPME